MCHNHVNSEGHYPVKEYNREIRQENEDAKRLYEDNRPFPVVRFCLVPTRPSVCCYPLSFPSLIHVHTAPFPVKNVPVPHASVDDDRRTRIR